MSRLAVARAVVWRRLARIRRRIQPASDTASPVRAGAPSARTSAVSRPAGDAFAAITPLIVDYFGRDGSTALLRLLSTSADVHVEGRYPYEEENLWPALAADDSARAWRAFCAGRFGAGAPRWYAEKMIDVRKLDLSPFPDARVIALLRDPRDTWISVEAFSRAVGAAEIGGTGSRAERLGRFVERQRERLDWIADLDDGDVLVVRYERLVGELPAVAADVGAWLGTELDPAGVAGDFRLRWVHGTSRDPASSVGRWRTELTDADRAALRDGLGERIVRLGFGAWDG